MKQIFIYSNGNISCFENGEQVVEIQRIHWIDLLLIELERSGVDIRKDEIRTLVNGHDRYIRVTSKQDEELQWRFIEF